MDLFDKYKNITGRKDSLYIYVLNNCSKQKILDHISSQIKLLDSISDNFKKKLFTKRYYVLRDNINNSEDEIVFNNIYFIDETVEEVKLSKRWISVLEKYLCNNILFKYDDHYDIEWLVDLLENDTPYEVININNNNLNYINMTKTKKYIVKSIDCKTIEVDNFITENIPKDKKVILYGTSSKFKGIKNLDKVYQIVNGNLKDSDLFEIIDRIENDILLDKLEKDLKMMDDSKTMDRVVFKNDIKKTINNGVLSRLYVDSKIHEKFINNMKKMDVDINFEIIQINTSIKSIIELREELIKKYDGVVGITYY